MRSVWTITMNWGKVTSTYVQQDVDDDKHLFYILTFKSN